MSQEARKLSIGEKRLLIAVVVFVALIGGGAIWWEQNNILPDISIPNPVMPNPNALDFYVKAGDQLEAVQLPATPTALRPNCWSFSTARQALEDQRTGQLANTAPVPSSAELHALLRYGAPGFAIMKHGLQCECRQPPYRAFNRSSPPYSKHRELARVLRLKMDVLEMDGDWGGAFDTGLDGIQFGATLPRGGTLLDMLVGVAIEAITRNATWKTLDHLTAPQARAGARRMEGIATSRPSLAVMMQEWKWGSLAEWLNRFRTPGWQNTVLELYGIHTQNAMQEWMLRARLAAINKRKFISDMTRSFDSQIASAKSPYAVPQPPITRPKDFIKGLPFRDFTRAVFKDVQNRTQNALLETALAVKAYQLEHGQYPTSLTALVPGFLKAIPDDPFALSGPLKYARKGKGYVLYSVGPDGKDNGGMPISPTGEGVTAQSTGDIVAGVNTW